MENVYGAAYYPEHWDESLWKKHIEIMKKYHIEWVRIGEFTWGLLETDDGIYDFSIVDKAISMLWKNGIKIIFGTPTAVPPSWLVKKYPEILPVNENGEILGLGSRRHYCVSNEIYQKYALRITEKIVERYASYVFIWQIDNEFGCEGTQRCYSESARLAFLKWLEKKYKNIDNLNKAWGTSFWAQKYSNWNQIDIPKKTPGAKNPHQVLDFYRFSSDAYIEFAKKQKEIIRKYSDAPITHNFMIDFFEIDYRKFAKEIDIISWDNYIATKEYDPFRQAANHDLMRSLKQKPFIIMEQQPGRVNWKIVNKEYPPTYLSLWVKQGYLHGASGNLIFRFRELPYGAEQFHGGLLSYSGEVRERLIEFSKTITSLKGSLMLKKEVGIYFDYENMWIHNINHLNKEFSYWNGILDIYKVIRKLGYNVDFIFSDSEIDKYDLIVVPYAMKINEEFTKKLLSYKGKIIMTAMSGVKDDTNKIVETIPDNISKTYNFKIKNFSGIDDVNLTFSNKTYKGYYWIDEIEEEGFNILGTYLDGPFSNTPSIIEKDNLIYIGTAPDSKLFHDILSYLGFNPKIMGNNVDVMETENGLFFLLNLSEGENKVSIEGKEVALSGFELKMLEI